MNYCRFVHQWSSIIPLKLKRLWCSIGLCCCLLLISQITTAKAANLKVAVASNFAPTLTTLADKYKQQTGQKILISAGSTGKLYAQILQGAPYDIYMAADSQRPQKLLQMGRVIDNASYTYAIGQLVLWGKGADGNYNNQQKAIERLKNPDFGYLAMANPKVAPYGLAALQVLNKLGLSETLRGKIVRGENIGQTFHFVETGNAQMGFVALAQLIKTNHPANNYWLIPQALYSPIEQQLVILKGSEQGQQFVAFLKSAQAKAIIQSTGYRIGA